VEGDPGGERKLIVDAALRVMRQNGYAAAQISDILGEAGLSTRAFYRHFQSKDDLLLAVFRDNAESTSRRLSARVLAAGAPPAQLDAWVDEILSLGYDRRRARRAALFASGAARRTAGYAEENRRAEQSLIDPLLEVLQAGVRSGDFPAAEPDTDARTIFALVWRFAMAGMAGVPPIPREEASRHVQRFVLPALGRM
jgi:AcrR family transcriptional regulator